MTALKASIVSKKALIFYGMKTKWSESRRSSNKNNTHVKVPPIKPRRKWSSGFTPACQNTSQIGFDDCKNAKMLLLSQKKIAASKLDFTCLEEFEEKTGFGYLFHTVFAFTFVLR